MPDYWGTDAGAWLDDPAQTVAIATVTRIAGLRSLRLRQTMTKPVVVQAHPTFVPEPSPYTLSAYLKADAENRQVRITLGWGAAAVFTVGRDWRRVHLTYKPEPEAKYRRGLEASMSLTGPGIVWIAAPQLEAGNSPTAFAPALADDHPLPEVPWGGDKTWVPSGTSPHHRAIVADGQARMFTAIAVQNPTAREFKDIASHGFSAIVLFVPASRRARTFPAEIERAVKLLDEAAEWGLKTVVLLTHAAVEPLSELTADVVHTIRALKTHTAVLCWIVLDEPSRQWNALPWSEIASLRAAAAGEDPGRPVVINENVWPADATKVLQATDVGSVDVYPIGQYANSVKIVADMSLRVNQSCAAVRKPTAMWLQMYGYDDAVREPTPEEARAMTYTTFIHGTRLLCYWIYKPLNPQLWASTKDTQQELARLYEILSAADARCVRIGMLRGRVHYALWTVASRAYLIACNVSPDSVLVRADLGRGGGSWHAEPAWFDAGPYFRFADSLWARLPGYGRQVWPFINSHEAATRS